MSVNDINDNKNIDSDQLHNNKENNVNSIKHNVFHAVYIPRDPDVDEKADDIIHVYEDKIEALKIIRVHKTSRLKTFSSRAEAEEFARCGSKIVNCIKNKTDYILLSSEENEAHFPQTDKIIEPPIMPFKCPTPQEMVAFRKAIEAGDRKSVKSMINSNPRYLIGSGFTPSILHEGCRYNALHAALTVKSTKPVEMCELLLTKISNPEFIEFQEGITLDKVSIDRSKMLLDLFLNTPDKGLNETPLHFAAKYGLKNVVKLLVSYPECIKTYKNKYEQTPVDVICSRKFQHDENLKQEIRMLIEDQYFVPVLRSEDNSLPPVIGEPFSPPSPPRTRNDPLSPVIQVKAFAGPMTKSQAAEFRKKWKTPPRNIFKTLTENRDAPFNESFGCIESPNRRDPLMRLQDSEKGVEMVGRDLAEQYSVPWKEYWSFIGNFADLRCPEGLDLLEKHFVNLHRKIREEKRLKQEMKKLDELLGTQLKIFNSSKEKDEARNNENSDIDAFYTPPESSNSSLTASNENMNDESDNMFDSEQHNEDNVFIDGNTPGKTDWAVLNAIPEFIDRDVYPLIYLWRHCMRSCKRETNHFSSTPGRRRLLLTPHTFSF